MNQNRHYLGTSISVSHVFSMLSKAVSPGKGKGHKPETSELQVRPRAGRIITIFIKLSNSPLQRTHKQGALTSLRASLPGLGGASASRNAGVTHLLSILVMPQKNQDRTGCPTPALMGSDRRYLLNLASSLKTYTSGTKPPDHLHPHHESNSSLVASLRSLSEATH